ncbi:DnaG DNA primase (bacterial type) [Burkholderiaceae bacterium]
MIPDSFIQDLLARVDVSDVVGRYVQLKKGGINLLGLCPFHNEKSPSFTVSPTKQFYHCFGCGAHGSAITFLIEHTGASFPEAVKTLASAVGMSVPEENRSPGQKAASSRRREEISQHTQVLDLAQKHYLSQLRESPAAIRYLKERGLTGLIAKEFGLGWASADRQALSKVFPRYDDAILVESGLVIASEDGRRYDRFRERIMFPIRNAKGEIVGFGGRIIGKGEPKYLNSPETPVFSKGNELYGLFEARGAIRTEGCVIVVEGYMDVVGLAQLGVKNAVATLGTATTPIHIQKLLRASDKIIFSFDGDGAGRRAAWRALQASLPLLRDDISIRFLFLPTEHDPDSYIRKFGEEAFRACLNESDALSTFFLNELSARHSTQELEGRSALVHEAKPLLAQIPAIALKVQLQNELARLVQFTPEELSQLMAQDAPHRMAGLPEPGRAAPLGRSTGEELRSPAESYYEEGASPRDDLSEGGGRHKRTARSSVVAGASRRAVAPLARRLLRLLLTHPELVDQMGEQQVEILARGPHLDMVRDLIVLIQASGARHVGALIQAADPGADLGILLVSVAEDLMSQESLPNPQSEWEDAVRRIELDSLKAEQQVLIGQGLNNLAAQQKYQELSQSITRLMRVIESSKST